MIIGGDVVSVGLLQRGKMMCIVFVLRGLKVILPIFSYLCDIIIYIIYYTLMISHFLLVILLFISPQYLHIYNNNIHI